MTSPILLSIVRHFQLQNELVTDDSNHKYMFLCGSAVEHCVSSVKGCGFDSQGTQILIKNV